LIGSPLRNDGIKRNKDFFRLADVLLEGYAGRAGFIAELLSYIPQGLKGEIAGIDRWKGWGSSGDVDVGGFWLSQ
jgi:hypothetical protein